VVGEATSLKPSIDMEQGKGKRISSVFATRRASKNLELCWVFENFKTFFNVNFFGKLGFVPKLTWVDPNVPLAPYPYCSCFVDTGLLGDLKRLKLNGKAQKK
jgi:hypothetical protein